MILLFSVLLFVFYLILTSENNPAAENDQTNSGQNQPTSEDSKKAEALKSEYENNSSAIFSEYLELINSPTVAAEEVYAVKQKFLDLKVPVEYKNLHLNLVLALVKMENYLRAGQESDKLESQQLISRAAVNYSWLKQKSSLPGE